MRFSPYRFLLLLTIVPSISVWLTKSRSRVLPTDTFLLAHVSWSMIALIYNHSFVQAWEPLGIHALEVFGSYFLARAYIRNVADLLFLLYASLTILFILLIFAISESISGINYIYKIVGGSPLTEIKPRWGLRRASASFEHPILYGTFVASFLGMAWYVAKVKSFLFSLVGCAVVVGSAFLSLSTGAYMAVSFQLFVIAWDRLTTPLPRRWLTLVAAFVACWCVVSVFSTRDPVRVFIWYLSFSRESAYSRIIIWDLGTAEVARHPIFGIGHNDWERPEWKSASFDNFWLFETMSYGVPAFVFLAAAFVLAAWWAGRLKTTDPNIRLCRAGWLTSLGGLSLAGATVHFWNATFCWLFFFLGAGMWIVELAIKQAMPSTPVLNNWRTALTTHSLRRTPS
jgi:hypothetical protein